MKFRVEYVSAADLVADADEQFAKGGYLVGVEPPPGTELYQEAELEIITPAGGARLVGQVVHMMSGHGVAVAFDPNDPQLVVLLQGAREAGGLSAGGARCTLVTDQSQGTGNPTLARSSHEGAYQQSQSANQADMIKLARYGKKDDRMMIMRGNNRSLHRYVLKNPGLQLDEVTAIAKMTNVAPDLLKAIAERREWASRPEIALALVRNPKTPVPLAIKMLNHVNANDLRQLAKGTSLRTPVLQAARKKVVSR